MDVKDWVIYFGIPVLCFVLIFLNQHRQARLKLKGKIRDSFGRKGNSKYFHEEFERISDGFFLDGPGGGIDDITWNDFDMDSVFKDMDISRSSLGREELYRILRTTDVGDDELKRRDELMEFFKDNPEERVDLQMEYNEFGFNRESSVASYLASFSDMQHMNYIVHLLCPIMLIAAILYACLVDAFTGMWAVIIIAGVNIVSYFKCKADIELGLIAVKNVFSMCRLADKICGLGIDTIKTETEAIGELKKKYAPAMRFSIIMTSGGGNVIDFFLDYVRMLTHLDLVKYCRVANLLYSLKDSTWELYHRLGYLEAMICASSYRESLSGWCRPQFTGKRCFEVKGLCHPLIENAVPNSISTKKSVLITGSNASGKSTFLRSAGICALLSQTIYTAPAQFYMAPKFEIMSSMALKDNLFANESYYMVEIKSLKRIMDKGDGDRPVLCFIDEVLRGTNTIERISASSQILLRLSQMNVLCFAATHDIELTTILEKHFDNYHFTEEISDDDVRFSYKLLSGRATSRNAIRLLGLLGYEKGILDKAYSEAGHFEDTGAWRQI